MKVGLFIGVLSCADWINGAIINDELAVLIICACSSKNLFKKHDFLRVAGTAERSQVLVFPARAHTFLSLRLL